MTKNTIVDFNNIGNVDDVKNVDFGIQKFKNEDIYNENKQVLEPYLNEIERLEALQGKRKLTEEQIQSLSEFRNFAFKVYTTFQSIDKITDKETKENFKTQYKNELNAKELKPEHLKVSPVQMGRSLLRLAVVGVVTAAPTFAAFPIGMIASTIIAALGSCGKVKWFSDKAKQLNDYTESKIKETEKGASFFKKLGVMALRAVNYVVKSIVTDGEFSIGNVVNQAYQDMKNSVLSNAYKDKVLTNNIDQKNLIQLTGLSHKIDIFVKEEQLIEKENQLKQVHSAINRLSSDKGNTSPQDATRLENIDDNEASKTNEALLNDNKDVSGENEATPELKQSKNEGIENQSGKNVTNNHVTKLQDKRGNSNADIKVVHP